MSTIIMTQCWPLQGMSAPQKAVLISLADNSNDDGVCWPSVAKIAERTCLSERAVRNALRWLEDAKILISHQRNGRSTWYTVTPASYAPGTTCPPAPDAAPPRHDVPPTPAPGAPRTVIEPSSEPSVETTAAAEDAKSKKTACPVEAIVDLFNEVLPELPTVVLINKDRKSKVQARWNDSEVHQDLGFWRDYFETVRASDFLMGRVSGRDGKVFRCCFDWLIAPSNFVKVVEGNYHA
ncbi:helix-turn-helix domain-containing protein [Pseudomonas aeruginosa]|uniref:helix-turn-helix domain-containing protein n=2 Tax=Pseudomonas aeruginosa TaxID=287 RepID=UPI0010BB2192|nr:helix-turn-helix domain-containing protein [Pseudomonas aeruginosa]VFT04282.1 phage replication protein [Pseudomonas aeruginosa]